MESLQHQRTVALVTFAHIAVAVFLLLFELIQTSRDALPSAVRVNLVSLPSPAPAREHPPEATAPEKTDQASKPQPEPSPPTPAPPPEPEPSPPTPAPPPEPVPTKPSWRPRSVDDIRENMKLSKPTRPRPSRPSIDAREIAERINRRISNVAVSFTSVGQEQETNAASAAKYFDMVGARLHSMWRQPSRAQVGGGRPTVTVSITVTANGTVSTKRVTGSSPVMAMNKSVINVLGRLERLPPLKDYGVGSSSLDIQVVFELD